MSNILLVILIIVILIYLITFIVNEFIFRIESSNEKKGEKLFNFENNLFFIGVIIVFIGVSTPFVILDYINYDVSNFKTFKNEDIGVIGDFFGGTSIGLLTLASLIFVATAMIMQRKELELQRNEVSATRKEYEITNRTMKKQSFDSTFFNMINLHQSILSQVKFEEYSGRVAFEEMYNDLKQFFEDTEYELWNFTLLDEYYPLEKRNKILYDTCIHSDQNKLKKEFQKRIKESESEEYGFLNIDRHKKLYELLVRMLVYPKDTLIVISDEENRELFTFLANNNLLYNENIDLNLLKKSVFKNLSSNHKKNIYENFYNYRENEIGHYYRNLYRIVKYIQEYDFSSNNDLSLRDEINFKEKKEYRGILRAQLSSYELLMIFYNVCYSEKGENFKILLHSTDFFDNHLVEEDFIWENDVDQLKYFKN